LAENIRLGKPDATDDEIEKAARDAALGAMIDRSSEGINQSVGKQGTALSGGERQRVAIARALLKNAPILILDEATSALDEETEQEIVTTIRALSSTVIFVTHRDSAIWQPTQTINLASTSV
ncbi:TPA: ATP-binding cassette domain-containing protein, partial [Acinetobacter baumannii]